MWPTILFNTFYFAKLKMTKPKSWTKWWEHVTLHWLSFYSRGERSFSFSKPGKDRCHRVSEGWTKKVHIKEFWKPCTDYLVTFRVSSWFGTKWNCPGLGPLGWCSSPSPRTAARGRAASQVNTRGAVRWEGELASSEAGHQALNLQVHIKPEPLSKPFYISGRTVTYNSPLFQEVWLMGQLYKSNRKLFHEWCHMLLTKVKTFSFNHCQNILGSFKR